MASTVYSVPRLLLLAWLQDRVPSPLVYLIPSPVALFTFTSSGKPSLRPFTYSIYYVYCPFGFHVAVCLSVCVLEQTRALCGQGNPLKLL